VENATLQGYSNYKDGYQKYEPILCDIDTPIILRYLIVRYANNGIIIDECQDVTVEGCLLGDTTAGCVVVSYQLPTDQKVTFRDNIFKNSEGPSITVMDFQFDKFDINTVPEFYIEGFFDIYNWKPSNELGNLLSALGLKQNAKHFEQYVNPDSLESTLNKVFKELVSSDKFMPLRYYYNGEVYFSLGVLFLGAMYKVDMTRVHLPTNSGLRINEMPLANLGGELGALIDLLNGITMMNGMPVTRPCYLLGQDFSRGKEPRYKPGEPIPQDKELFEKLRSGAEK
jgi:hypothetical protein